MAEAVTSECCPNRTLLVTAAGLDFASFDSLEATKAAAKEALTKHVDDADGACSSSLRNIDDATSSGQVGHCLPVQSVSPSSWSRPFAPSS